MGGRRNVLVAKKRVFMALIALIAWLTGRICYRDRRLGECGEWRARAALADQISHPEICGRREITPMIKALVSNTTLKGRIAHLMFIK